MSSLPETAVAAKNSMLPSKKARVGAIPNVKDIGLQTILTQMRHAIEGLTNDVTQLHTKWNDAFGPPTKYMGKPGSASIAGKSPPPPPKEPPTTAPPQTEPPMTVPPTSLIPPIIQQLVPPQPPVAGAGAGVAAKIVGVALERPVITTAQLVTDTTSIINQATAQKTNLLPAKYAGRLSAA